MLHAQNSGEGRLDELRAVFLVHRDLFSDLLDDGAEPRELLDDGAEPRERSDEHDDEIDLTRSTRDEARPTRDDARR
jgi:hypothetical protein